MYNVASLFCGCGGLDLGLRGNFALPYYPKPFPKGGFKIVWANDFDLNATMTYARYFGNHVVHGDIVQIMDDVKAAVKSKKPLPHNFPSPGTVDVVTGGFPCQPFSLAGKRKGLGDRRGKLYLAMCDAIKVLKPKAFIAENVRGLMSMDGGGALDMIVADLGAIGYQVSFQLYKAMEWGVPQTRERVIIVGVRNDIPAFEHSLPDPKRPIVSLKEAISGRRRKRILAKVTAYVRLISLGQPCERSITAILSSTIPLAGGFLREKPQESSLFPTTWSTFRVFQRHISRLGMLCPPSLHGM